MQYLHAVVPGPEFKPIDEKQALKAIGKRAPANRWGNICKETDFFDTYTTYSCAGRIRPGGRLIFQWDPEKATAHVWEIPLVQ